MNQDWGRPRVDDDGVRTTTGCGRRRGVDDDGVRTEVRGTRDECGSWSREYNSSE
jgi:hypothetical protein